jgi:hypothetical protein
VSLTDGRHDTRSPLSCCPRCHKAELAGRARHRPVFRYEKVESAGTPSSYRVFHGEEHVATLGRAGGPGPAVYEVVVEWDGGGEDLKTPTLRDARLRAEEAYTAVWLEGRYLVRGPVRSL